MITASAISGTASGPSQSRKTCAGSSCACSRPRCSPTRSTDLAASQCRWRGGEVIPAAQQGVIDGADLPIVNILALKAYEVSKYCSMTYHNYGPTAAVINLDSWNGMTDPQRKLLQETSRTGKAQASQLTESADKPEKAQDLRQTKG